MSDTKENDSSQKGQDTSRDTELDDLLDSALEDFNKHKDDSAKPSASGAAGGSGKPGDQVPSAAQLFSDLKATGDNFEKTMAAIFGCDGDKSDNEKIMLGMQRIAEAAGLAIRSENTTDEATPANTLDPAISQTINDALKAMSEGQDNLQSPFSPEDIANMFGNIDLNATGENNAFLPFMHKMMQSLLSPDVLLPCIRELVERYPAWLTEHGPSLPKEERELYEKQLKLLKEVSVELQKEKEDDPEDVKRALFQSVLDKMQALQDLGPPPAELVGDLAPGNPPMLDPSLLNEQNPCPMS